VCERLCARVHVEWEEDIKYSVLSIDEPLQPWSGGFILTLQVIAGGVLTKVTSEHHPLPPPVKALFAARFLLRTLLLSHSCLISLCLYLNGLDMCLCASLQDYLLSYVSIVVLSFEMFEISYFEFDRNTNTHIHTHTHSKALFCHNCFHYVFFFFSITLFAFKMNCLKMLQGSASFLKSP